MRTLIEGTIVKWVDGVPLVNITRYYEEGKKRRVLKCNHGQGDTALIENFMAFKKVE